MYKIQIREHEHHACFPMAEKYMGYAYTKCVKGKMCNRPCENRIDYIGYKYMHFVESSRKTS